MKKLIVRTVIGLCYAKNAQELKASFIPGLHYAILYVIVTVSPLFLPQCTAWKISHPQEIVYSIRNSQILWFAFHLAGKP